MLLIQRILNLDSGFQIKRFNKPWLVLTGRAGHAQLNVTDLNPTNWCLGLGETGDNLEMNGEPTETEIIANIMSQLQSGKIFDLNRINK